MTDDIQKVREAYEAAMEEAMGYCGDGPKYGEYYRNAFVQALAKRLQPRPVPEKKAWSVSEATGARFAMTKEEAGPWSKHLDRFAPDIIRERPDLVAAEWERRYRAFRAKNDCAHPDIGVKIWRRDLFPELDP